MREYRLYTKDEVALLRARYPAEGAAPLVDVMDRERKDIANKARRLGLSCQLATCPHPPKREKAVKKKPPPMTAAQLIDACVNQLVKTNSPLTSKELAARIRSYPRHVGLTLARANDSRFYSTLKKDRTRVWALTKEYRESLPGLTADQPPADDHDDWFAALQKEVIHRRFALQQIRGRV